MDSIFREQAVSAQNQRGLGEILIVRPMSVAFLTAAAVLIAATIVAFLMLAEYTRKERVTGQLIMSRGLVKVYPPSAGTIVRRLVGEGSQVEANQPLYVLSTERVSSARGDTQAEIVRQLALRKRTLREERTKQARILAEEEAALRRKIRDLANEEVQLGREIEIQETRVGLARESVRRLRVLLAQGYVSQAFLDEKEQDHLEQQTRLQALERTRLSARREISAFESDLENAPLKAQNALAAIDRQVAALEQDVVEGEARREMVVPAPQDGTVTAVLGEPGQWLTPNQPLASILPKDAAIEAVLYVPSRAIGFVETGKPVQIRYPAYPYQKFGQYSGTVKEIARTALAPEELKLVGATQETFFRVVVSLDSQSATAYGKQIRLQDGMQLEADILIDTRRLYEWVLDPLYSLTGKL